MIACSGEQKAKLATLLDRKLFDMGKTVIVLEEGDVERLIDPGLYTAVKTSGLIAIVVAEAGSEAATPGGP